MFAQRGSVGARQSFETRVLLACFLAAALLLACVPCVCLAQEIAGGAANPETAGGAADPDAEASILPADEGLAAGIALEADDLAASAGGLGLTLPEGARVLEQGKDRGFWLVDYPDGGRLLVSVDNRAWSGSDAGLAAFALYTAEAYAAESPGGALDEGDWATYGDVRAYACGYAEADGLLLCAVTATGDEAAARLLMSYRGADVAGVAAGDMADILTSLRVVDDPSSSDAKRGRIMYYDALDIVGLDGHQILEVLEDDWGFDYAEVGESRGWVGLEGEPVDALSCFVRFTTMGDAKDGAASTIDPRATRDMLAGDVALSGIEVLWPDAAPVEWDEPSDVARALQRECGLTGMLDDGYTSDWGSDGSFTWMRIGACQIDGEDAFWSIEVASPGENERCQVTLAVDLLDNGHGGGFASYGELVDTVFGE